MKTLSEFREHYDQELVRYLVVLEKKRKGIVSQIFSIHILSFLLILVSFFLVWYLEATVAWAILAFLALSTFAGIMHYNLINNQRFYHKFKINLIDRVVRFINPGLHYNPRKYVPVEHFNASGIFPIKAVRKLYTGDDFVCGRFDNNTIIEFSEVHALIKGRSKQNQDEIKEKTIFQGLFFVAQVAERFSGSLVVAPKKMRRVGDPNTHPMDLPELDSVFRKRFRVFATHPQLVLDILDPNLQQQLVDFQAKREDDIYLSFKEQQAFVAIGYSKELFEPHVFKTLLDRDLAEEYYEDLYQALSIVEHINKSKISTEKPQNPGAEAPAAV